MKLDTERRRHKRFKYEALISHDVSSDGNLYPGQMFNFSKGGLYFESDQAISPGEDIYVALAIPAGSPSKETQLPLEVKIIWRLALEDSSCDYGYGGKFLSTYDAFTEYAYPGASGETGKFSDFSVSYLKIGRNLSEKSQHTEIHNKTELSQPPDLFHADRHVTETGQIQEAVVKKKALPSYEFQGENDPRKNTRKPYNQSCVFSYDSHEYQGIVTNICRGGAFILTQDNFVLGGRLTLVIPELKTRKAVKVTGWIVRISPEGIGVSFERRVSRERRSDLDRRTGSERRGRKRRKPRS